MLFYKKFCSEFDSFPVNQKVRTLRELLEPSRKQSVGGSMYSSYYTPRVMDIFYLPNINSRWWTELSTQLIRFRNKLLGLDDDFAINSTGDFFTVPRIHRYPQGGGFLAPHFDRQAPKATKDLGGSAYYQVSLALTSYGKDYKSGGGYVVLEDKLINFDKYSQSGDIVIYDGKTLHGVMEVDPLQQFSFNNEGARSSLFVTLYDKRLAK